MEISLRTVFKDFNASKFLLYGCLLFFSILFSLRLDGLIELNYAIVFLPLWFCECIVFIGAVVAIISYFISPPSATDVNLRTDFLALLICTGEHALLTMFECLVCYKLQTKANVVELSWVFVFVPLFALSLISVAFAIWAIRHEKSFEMELFFSVNIVQFVFIAFKLDDLLEWHWAIVFIPLWVVLTLCAVGVLYALILAMVLSRSVHIMASQRRQNLLSAVCHTILVAPILIFLLLLTIPAVLEAVAIALPTISDFLFGLGKLDRIEWDEAGGPKFSYFLVSIPLMISLLCLVIMSMGAKGGNPWWFAMRTQFCDFFLEWCPCLKQYANLSYKCGSWSCRDGSSSDFERQSLNSDRSVKFSLRPIVNIHFIESPD